MQSSIYQFKNSQWDLHPLSRQTDQDKAGLVLCFVGKEMLKNEDAYAIARRQFSNAAIVLCSTAGEIYNDNVQDNSFVAASLEFEKTTIQTVSVNIKDFESSYAAAASLTTLLPKEDLVYILILSDGNMVNGSELVRGLNECSGKQVLVTGGLAGDGANFSSTLVGLNEKPEEGRIVAVGFYGNNIFITHGSDGGWDIFGLEKRVTKSTSNRLFEIENQSALNLYKKYLGPEANNLPVSSLLFPLSVVIPGAKEPVVRTILSINEEDNSMTFAGDIPEGSKVRFMKANFDKITQAASTAAQYTLTGHTEPPCFSLLISCVGRKLILGDRTGEEVKAVNECFNGQTMMAGFYSYGEISPFNKENNCQLHNQTMTITSFYEN